MPRAAANTPRNIRLERLAGATVLGRELGHARASVNAALARHRNAQARAKKPYNFGGLTVASTRAQVRKAVAWIRDIEVRCEAQYGAQLPVMPGTKLLHAPRTERAVEDLRWAAQ